MGRTAHVRRDLCRCEKGVRSTPLQLLFTDLELLDERAILVDVLLGEIIEQAAALADHFQQPAAAVVILGILLEVWRERINVLGENGDLYFRAPRVVRRLAELRRKLLLLLFCNWHIVSNDSARMNVAATSRYERPGDHVLRPHIRA